MTHEQRPMKRVKQEPKRRPVRAVRPWSWAVIGSLAALSPASAQTGTPPELDQATLIGRLADEGMTELLDHLVATDPPTDPVVASQVTVSANRVRFRNAEDPADRAEALAGTLRALRDAIAAHPDHPQRPIWQTELAEQLITEHLTSIHQHAAEFYEFGVPTVAQREAFEASVAEAFLALAEASLRLAQLQTLLPREPDYREKYVRTGLEQRYFEEYANKRTRFYHGLAAYLVTRLPDDHPYFRGGSRTPSQRPSASEEKPRLAELAIERMSGFVNDALDAAGVRLPALTVTARAQLVLQRPGEAAASFQPVLEASAGNLFELIAHLGSARVLVQQKQFPAAIDRLHVLADRGLVRDNLLFRLLVTDALHRARLAQAEEAPAAQRPAAVAAAYEPYVDLINDPSLGESAEGLRNYVYARWGETLDVSTPETLPPIVRGALGELRRIEGQNLAIEAEQQEDPEARAAARERLAQAIALNESLLDHPSDALRARAMFNLALARYFTNPQDLANVLASVALFVELADELPAQRQSVEGMRYALGLLRELHQLEPRPQGVAEAYQAAVDVLFSKYGTEAIADDERLYYGYYVLVPAGKFVEAVEVLSQVPQGHPDYFDAQREMLFAREETLRETPASERAAVRDALVEAAERLQADVEASVGAGDAARGAMAATELVLAGAALDAAGAGRQVDQDQIQRAMRLLEGFEERYAGMEDLIRLGLERRIMALAASQQLDALSRESREMMTAYPDAAAYVVDQVLTNLDEEVTDLRARAAVEESLTRQRELQADAESRARTAAALADMLVSWARDRGYNREEMLPYQLVLVRSRRLAGQPAEALGITAGLMRDFGENAEVIHEHGESLFALGGEQNLLQAASLYDRLIGGLPADPAYPPLWWNAWMRRLQINDQLNAGVEDIAIRVRQLKLTDPNLGGPPYQEALERLAEKHAR